MPVICPKCSHVRPNNATNPEWECPACGVCYARFDNRPAASTRRVQQVKADAAHGWNVRLIFTVLLVIVVGWGVSMALKQRKDAPPVAESTTADVPQRAADPGVAAADTIIALSETDATLLHTLAGRLEQSCARTKYGLTESACVARLREREHPCANTTAQRFPGQIGDTSRMEVIVKAYVACIFEGD